MDRVGPLPVPTPSTSASLGPTGSERGEELTLPSPCPHGTPPARPLAGSHRPLPHRTVAPLQATTFTARRWLPAVTRRGPTRHRRRCPPGVRHLTAATAPMPHRRSPRHGAPPRQSVIADLRSPRPSAKVLAVGRETVTGARPRPKP